MDNHPRVKGAWVSALAWGALIYSGLIFVINWSTSWLGGRTALQDFFGEELLTPIILVPFLLLVSAGLDVVAVWLTLRIAPKTQRKTNLIICAIALVILIAMISGPFIAQSIYSGRVRG